MTFVCGFGDCMRRAEAVCYIRCKCGERSQHAKPLISCGQHAENARRVKTFLGEHSFRSSDWDANEESELIWTGAKA